MAVLVVACGDNLTPQTDQDAGPDAPIDAPACVPVNDNNPCTEDTCQNNVPVNTPTPGATCMTTGVCNATGGCDLPSCTDNMMNGTETGVDCGGSCAPASQCDPGEGCMAPTDCTSGVCNPTTHTCSAPVCGDGIMQGTEACDDGNMMNNDGCDDGVGGSCRPTACGNGTVTGTEVCDDGNTTNGDGCDNNCTASGCGNGLVGGAETCDQGGGNVADGDGCSSACLIETGYACMGVPSTCAPVCGNGIITSPETCDQGGGNVVDGDGCSATCLVETGFLCAGTPSVCTRCGNGTVDAGEECDDSNQVDGDGCSATCTFDLLCGAGQTAISITNTMSLDVPDTDPAGVTSTIMVPTTGAVRRVQVRINNLTHSFDADLDMFLIGPNSLTRELSTDNGSVGENYIATVFDDGAAASITTATAPMTGTFRPEQTLNALAGTDFLTQSAAGAWQLKLVDDASGDLGLLTSWTLLMCVDPTGPRCGDGMVGAGEECDDGNTVDTDACSNFCGIVDGCGDGNLDAGEQCDDNNLVSGDECSATCLIDITCGAGETPVLVFNNTALPIPDNTPAGVSSPAVVTTVGAVTRASVIIGDLTHTFDGDVDMVLVSPGGRRRELSTDNGAGGDNFSGTVFADNATTAITAGTAPFTGKFLPEQSLATTAGADFAALNAAGTWNLALVDDASGDTGTLNVWTLAMCVNTTAAYCGDGTPGVGEECDDGNTENADACTNLCQVTDGCGDGNLDPSEQCDDDNLATGDGCSATCQVEITCIAPQKRILLSNTTATAIPDNTPAGITSTVNATTFGAITKVRANVNITHTNDADIDMFLVAPNGVRRELATDNGGTGDNYAGTLFDDTAVTAITAGVAPMTGTFRPEQTLSTTAGTDFRGANGAGTWTLTVADDLTAETGTLNSWVLAACVDPTVPYCGDTTVGAGEECDDGNTVATDACNNLCQITEGCGDGNLDTGEQCDDDNLVSGDGCSATCQVEINCAAGQTPVLLSNTTALPLTDALPAGLTSTLAATTAGAVAKVIVSTRVTHTNDADVDMFLMAPNGVERELSTDNGSTGDNYAGTIFDDAATTAITAGVAPFAGRFRPELSLSATAGTDHLGTRAAGTWTLRIADDLATNTGQLDGWIVGICVDTAAAFCGDGVVGTGEECDDSNTVNTDACSNRCQLVDGCGDGNLDTGEQCDDDNVVAGDGCSATCQLEITCAAGETPVVVANGTAAPIPDNLAAGVSSPVMVTMMGSVTKVIVSTSITHTFDGDVDIFLLGPNGAQRELSTDNGGGGDNFAGTIFDDAATNLVTAGTAPFAGRFKPEQSLAATVGVDFKNSRAAGTWTLKVADDATGDTGTLNSWVIGLCVSATAPLCGDSMVTTGEECDDGNTVNTDACNNLCGLVDGCGDGNVDTGEQCDDDNLVSGDGCSATCQLEIACAASETPVVVLNSTALPITDNNTTGVQSPVTVATTGTVSKVQVFVNITHTFDGDVALSLIGPTARTRNLVVNRGGGGDNFARTLFDDTATTAITAGTAPFTGRFRPEQSLSTTAANDFLSTAAAGTWNLKAVDNGSGDAGTITSWALLVCVAP